MRKIELTLEYARRAGLRSDTVIILRTLLPWLERMGSAHSQRED
jgi:hypothetical protein